MASFLAQTALVGDVSFKQIAVLTALPQYDLLKQASWSTVRAFSMMVLLLFSATSFSSGVY
jgi:hypothetical protein